MKLDYADTQSGVLQQKNCRTLQKKERVETKENI